jgi:hypothetical protein
MMWEWVWESQIEKKDLGFEKRIWEINDGEWWMDLGLQYTNKEIERFQRLGIHEIKIE